MFTAANLLFGLVAFGGIIILPGILNPKKYRKALKSITSNEDLVRITGLYILLFSFIFLSVHWRIDQTKMTLISVFGWLGTLKGITFIWYPKSIKKITKTFYGTDKKVSIILLFAFIALIALGYITHRYYL